MPKPPLPSGDRIRYLPTVCPRKNIRGAQYSRLEGVGSWELERVVGSYERPATTNYRLRTTNCHCIIHPVPRFYAPALTPAGRDACARRMKRRIWCVCCASSRDARSASSTAVDSSVSRAWSSPTNVASCSRIVGEASAAPELPFPLVLAQAVLKGVAMDRGHSRRGHARRVVDRADRERAHRSAACRTSRRRVVRIAGSGSRSVQRSSAAARRCQR